MQPIKAALLLLAVVPFSPGCATPGMTFTWTATFPSTQIGSNLVHSIPTAVGTTYAIESPAQVPLCQRQYQVVAPPPPPIATQPPRQLLPMPKETPPAGCQGGA